eukprot:TRINITY_DN5732_c0_g1_i1.p1 TRINITY_DN5732_c0_g1~~TRINITY_DN5732_c0_g1_i1.p1  ORF type:complete len:431 (+),score=83.03 TRINITY_DN5732_c0_g1_i1:41-1294(+)
MCIRDRYITLENLSRVSCKKANRILIMDYNEILGKTAIVIDNGSGITKVGFNGDEAPMKVFPTYVGRPKLKAVLPTQNSAEYYLGLNPQMEKLKGVLKLRYPMSHGVVRSKEDWSDMELIWKHIYSELKVSSKEHPVLLTEPPNNPLPHKIKIAKTFFESFNSPAIFFAVQAVMSLYASGKTTGVVLDSGDGVTHCVPVYEGFSVSHAINRIDIGGRDVTDHLMLLLRRAGHVFHTSCEFEIVRKIKERCCSVASSPLSDDRKYEEKTIPSKYILPDGAEIDLGSEKQRAPEILFAPENIGLEYPSVSELLVNSIAKSDIDIRKTFYNEILLAGGNTMTQGFPERYLYEIKKLAPKEMKIKLYAPDNRHLSCWFGGSILCSLSSFNKMWITKKEYDEEGERILLKKLLQLANDRDSN